MHAEGLPYAAAVEEIRWHRAVGSPTTAFMVHLLQWEQCHAGALAPAAGECWVYQLRPHELHALDDAGRWAAVAGAPPRFAGAEARDVGADDPAQSLVAYMIRGPMAGAPEAAPARAPCQEAGSATARGPLTNRGENGSDGEGALDPRGLFLLRTADQLLLWRGCHCEAGAAVRADVPARAGVAAEHDGPMVGAGGGGGAAGGDTTAAVRWRAWLGRRAGQWRRPGRPPARPANGAARPPTRRTQPRAAQVECVKDGGEPPALLQLLLGVRVVPARQAGGVQVCHWETHRSPAWMVALQNSDRCCRV
jgi:hypothetical protein